MEEEEEEGEAREMCLLSSPSGLPQKGHPFIPSLVSLEALIQHGRMPLCCLRLVLRHAWRIWWISYSHAKKWSSCILLDSLHVVVD